MEGNRKAYILGINTFLKLLATDSIGLKEVPERTENFKTNLERFSKSTFRPYKILQEFFSNESKELAIQVKNIESLHNDLEGAIKKAKIDNIEATRALIKKLTNRTNKKGELQQEIKQNENQLTNLKDEKSKVEEEYESLRGSKEFKELLEHKAEKEVTIKQLQTIQASVRFPFTSIEAALKKYERIAIEDTELINNYLKDPVSALQDDKGKKILSVIEKAKSAIEKGSLDLKDKKKGKILTAIESITEEQLDNFQSNLSNIQEKIQTIQESITSNPSREEEITTKDKLAILEKKIPTVEGSISTKKEELEKINLESIKSSIIHDLKETLSINISIVSQNLEGSDGKPTES